MCRVRWSMQLCDVLCSLSSVPFLFALLLFTDRVCFQFLFFTDDPLRRAIKEWLHSPKGVLCHTYTPQIHTHAYTERDTRTRIYTGTHILLFTHTHREPYGRKHTLSPLPAVYWCTHATFTVRFIVSIVFTYTYTRCESQCVFAPLFWHWFMCSSLKRKKSEMTFNNTSFSSFSPHRVCAHTTTVCHATLTNHNSLYSKEILSSK